MNEHDWVKTDGPAERPKMSLFYSNTWNCSKCGAKSGPLKNKPSPHSRINKSGYVDSAAIFRCEEYMVYKVSSS